MPTVLIVDDEEGIRKNIERLLSLEGYDVATAPNGHAGLILARSVLPDVLITDVNMPGLDGFELVNAVRANPELAHTAIIMLTAVEDRANMRRGMVSGADDYITKPFKREELLESLHAQLKKRDNAMQRQKAAVADAVTKVEGRLTQMFKDRYSEMDDARSFDAQSSFSGSEFSASHGNSESLQEATILFADIRGFTSIAERLSADELAQMLGQYFELACQPVVNFGGLYMKMMGDGLMALFQDTSDEVHEWTHARRAVLAAIALRDVAQDFARLTHERFTTRGLKPFAIGVGLHAGPATLSRLGTGPRAEITPVGDTVNIAARLEAASKELGWTIVASSEAVSLAGHGISTGRVQLVPIRGRVASVQACEIKSLTSELDFPLPQVNTDASAQNAALRVQARQNSEMTAKAAKDAIKQSLWSLKSGAFQSGIPQRFKGYFVERKLGEGGMSDVYLAYSEALKTQVVLKVLRTDDASDSDMLRRFIQEYAVLGSVLHPHIARIYDQGFTDTYAYIAMEYLSGGELKSLVSAQLAPQRVMALLRQVLSALTEVHRLGLVYRDLKPDNLMFRDTGELVLVDFGIVKSTRTLDTNLVRTQHGQIVGTPYYISPEQANNAELTHRSDFYSLGVMMYELLVGDKPYKADSLDLLLARHMHGATPILPSALRAYQPLLSQLMAKSAAERPADCEAIIAILDGIEHEQRGV